MNVDGYVTFVLSPIDEEKGKIIDYKLNDLRLQEYFSEFVDMDSIDSIISIQEVMAINPDVKDCLVLVTFKFQSIPSFNGESTEYEDEITVRDVIVLDTNYKEQWRRNLTTEYGYASLEELEANKVDMQDIHEWEEFYDEDFEFFKSKPVELISLENLFK